MSTTIEVMTNALMEKVFTDSDKEALIKELKPIYIKEIKKQFLSALNNIDLTEDIQDILGDKSYDIALDLFKQVSIESKFVSKKKGAKK